MTYHPHNLAACKIVLNILSILQADPDAYEVFDEPPIVVYRRAKNLRHTANLTQQWREHYGWEILRHPAHSPDLAPSDFHLFVPLNFKRHLERAWLSRQKVTSSVN
ncbi:histone-lysine N-methyltransferase SETMAR [Elysia marginata]|uniref:Histone-lysine N-methyltransferase SETMAR n=1 Tax=Elysia marginata TaxID=1093978 RepID=A0AAV4H1R3_9GAST|nr:histone-lysine N-methyltransferase SETMAR [Elysia marginata]